MTQITFIYNDELKKWQVVVSGVENETEAVEAFTAVVMTCQMLNPRVLAQSPVKDHVLGFEIIPAVL